MTGFNPEKQILYEDNHLIVVNKYPSQIVQGDKTGDPPLSDLIKKYLKDKYNKPGNVFLGVVHRLDRPVSGVVVFARTSKALSRLNELLRKNEISKTYWAVVKSRPKTESGVLRDYLLKDEKKNKSFVVKQNKRGGKAAELHYRLLLSGKTYHLLEIELITGRHHQIRTQLSHAGFPIKGDLKYGFPRSNEQPFIHLHARSLSLIHPVSKEQLNISADPPEDVLWNMFLSRSGK